MDIKLDTPLVPEIRMGPGKVTVPEISLISYQDEIKIRLDKARDSEFLVIRHLHDTDELVVLHHRDLSVEPECVFSLLVTP